QEVDDGGAFAEKFWIGDHVEVVRIDTVAVHYAADPFIGIDRHSALFDDDLVAVDGAGDLADHGLDVGQVRRSGAALRGSDGDKDGLALLDSVGQVGGELDA